MVDPKVSLLSQHLLARLGRGRGYGLPWTLTEAPRPATGMVLQVGPLSYLHASWINFENVGPKDVRAP